MLLKNTLLHLMLCIGIATYYQANCEAILVMGQVSSLKSGGIMDLLANGYLRSNTRSQFLFCGVNGRARDYNLPCNRANNAVPITYWQQDLSWSLIIDSTRRIFGECVVVDADRQQRSKKGPGRSRANRTRVGIRGRWKAGLSAVGGM